MARYNKIYLGPVDKPKPQVRELLASVTLLPGCLTVIDTGKFALAGTSTTGKVRIVQDNYLQLKGVDTAWAQDDRAICMELQDGHIYAGRIPTGVNITAIDTPLTCGASGKLAIAGSGDYVVAFADEVYNNNTGADQLIRIRVAGVPGPQGPQGEPGGD
jgi:hypothetical protein